MATVASAICASSHMSLLALVGCAEMDRRSMLLNAGLLGWSAIPNPRAGPPFPTGCTGGTGCTAYRAAADAAAGAYIFQGRV